MIEDLLLDKVDPAREKYPVHEAHTVRVMAFLLGSAFTAENAENRRGAETGDISCVASGTVARRFSFSCSRFPLATRRRKVRLGKPIGLAVTDGDTKRTDQATEWTKRSCFEIIRITNV